MPTDFMIARATWPVDLLISRGKWQLDSMISRDALQLDWMISGLLLMWMSVTRSFPLRNFLWSSIHDMFIYYIYIYINISWYLQQSWLTVFKRALPTSRFKSNGIWLYLIELQKSVGWKGPYLPIPIWWNCLLPLSSWHNLLSMLATAKTRPH